ncbi:hypothetical protein ACEPWL_34745, partial [Pseudomonas aeruginosa]
MTLVQRFERNTAGRCCCLGCAVGHDRQLARRPRHSGFHDYGRLWLLDGNAKGAAVETLLRDLFGLNGPGA